MEATGGAAGRPETGPVEQVSAVPSGFTSVVRHGVVDSTNRLALDAARAGAAEGLVVVTDAQDAGRGRLGRSWSAPAGGALLCSIVFRPRLAVGQLHLVQVAVALAARAAVADCTGCVVALKWPNDLVAAERKLAGLLSEVVAGPGGAVAALVVGLGLNCSFPEGYSIPDLDGALAPVTLEDLVGRRVPPDEVLERLLVRLAPRHALLSSRAGREALEQEYRSALSTIGQRVRVETVASRFEGRALGVADDGCLVVEVAGATVRVDAGDVVHLRAP